MEQLDYLKKLINEGDVDRAIEELNKLFESDSIPNKDTLFYLRGNAYRKKSNWQQALNSYQSAIELNPNSPAVHARQIVMDILEFFHKDMYNQ